MPLNSKEGLSAFNENLSRRAFLKAFVLGSTAVALATLDPISDNPQGIVSPAMQRLPSTIPSQEMPREYVLTELTSEPPPASLSRTVVDTLAFNLARFGVLVPILDKLGIPYGSPSAEPTQLPFWDEKHPIKSQIIQGVAGSTVIPAIEEFAFHLGPSAIFADYSPSTRWDVGISSSILFASVHNIVKDKETKRSKFTTKSIPVTQFLGGLFYWKMLRERGYWHSTVAHGISNLSQDFVELGTNISKKVKKQSKVA